MRATSLTASTKRTAPAFLALSLLAACGQSGAPHGSRPARAAVAAPPLAEITFKDIRFDDGDVTPALNRLCAQQARSASARVDEQPSRDCVFDPAHPSLSDMYISYGPRPFPVEVFASQGGALARVVVQGDAPSVALLTEAIARKHGAPRQYAPGTTAAALEWSDQRGTRIRVVRAPDDRHMLLSIESAAQIARAREGDARRGAQAAGNL